SVQHQAVMTTVMTDAMIWNSRSFTRRSPSLSPRATWGGDGGGARMDMRFLPNRQRAGMTDVPQRTAPSDARQGGSEGYNDGMAADSNSLTISEDVRDVQHTSC